MWSKDQGKHEASPDGNSECQTRQTTIHSWPQYTITNRESHSHKTAITQVSPYISYNPVGVRGVEQPHINLRNKVAPDSRDNERNTHAIIEKHRNQTNHQALESELPIPG